jgi:transcriptional regulator with XRE-family HTH domain
MTDDLIKKMLMKIGESVKDQRIKSGFTIKEISQSAGVAPGTIWRIEKGHNGATMESVVRVWIALGIDINNQ